MSRTSGPGEAFHHAEQDEAAPVGVGLVFLSERSGNVRRDDELDQLNHRYNHESSRAGEEGADGCVVHGKAFSHRPAERPEHQQAVHLPAAPNEVAVNEDYL